VTVNLRLRWLLALCLSLLWSYLAVVLLYDEGLAGASLGAGRLYLLIVAGWVVVFAAVSWLERRQWLGRARQKDLIAAALSILLALLGLDLAYSGYVNLRRAGRSLELVQYERLSDPHLWHGELAPRSYYPTGRKFTVYKPGVRSSAVTYGEFYEPEMLDSPLLVAEVLEPRSITYTIDENGFRNTRPVAESRIYALGDSFALGWTTDEQAIWTERLGKTIGEPIYNLGVSATGPGVQLQLLEHFLATHPDEARPERLLWMIYEGNDLENSYAERRSPAPRPPGGLRGAARGTLLEALFEAPAVIRNESVLARLLGGGLTLRRRPADADPYLVDGVRLATPLYRSERWGYRLFNPEDVERATKDESYVLSHPHWPALERTFARMKDLAASAGFEVTVLIAPTAARVYGADFEGLPPLSAEPHFIRQVETLAERNGFETIDLLDRLAPFTEKELLYYRDDHHWNARGNEVVAGVVAEELGALRAAQP